MPKADHVEHHPMDDPRRTLHQRDARHTFPGGNKKPDKPTNPTANHMKDKTAESVVSKVRSVECQVWSVEYGVESVECQVWSVRCRVKCRVWSVECKVCCVEGKVSSVECSARKLWGVECKVRLVKCGV